MFEIPGAWGIFRGKPAGKHCDQPRREVRGAILGLLALALLFFASLLLPFETKMFALGHFVLEVGNFSLPFYRGSQLRDCLEPQKIWTLEQYGTTKPVEDSESWTTCTSR